MKRITLIFTVLMLTVGVVLSIASASVGNIEKTLLYDNIKITLDGEEIKPADVNGNYIEPFIIEGTTYLPVRGIASSLGLSVGWDGETNTVKLNEPLRDTLVLYDKSKIKINFKKYEYTAEGDLMLRLYVENGNSDDITLRAKHAYVNGNLIDTSFSADFSSGKKGNADIVIKAQKLKENNINYIKEIELVTDVINASTGEKFMDSGVITVSSKSAVLSERSSDEEKDKYENITHKNYVDFIKANGENVDGSFKVTHAFFEKEYENQRATLFLISLGCSDEDDNILLSVLMNREPETTGKSDNTYLDITISPDASSYSFKGKLLKAKIEGKVTADEKILTPDGWTIEKNIVENYNMGGFTTTANVSDETSKLHVATQLSDMMKLIAEHGDGIFEKYGSELSLGFFGIEK
ncbi:MAG: copper amine oxidase N-terminal domain-containing protein [Ruminococcaceae bacterium]|nr:copper amine oxidase N-terminal domain-containing protein [Oscillospiraceae bacterium]